MTKSSRTRAARRAASAKPIVAYAYMPARYSRAAAAEGIFRLRRLSAFRTMENEALRDPLEGKAASSAMSFAISELTTEQRAALNKHGFLGFPPNFDYNQSSINFIDCEFFKISPDYFTLCTSWSGANRHLETIHDGLIKIIDVAGFAQAIGEAHSIHITGWGHGDVVYDDRPFDPLSAEDVITPFQKRTRYAPEQERRIIWSSRGGEPAELMTHARGAARFLKWIR